MPPFPKKYSTPSQVGSVWRACAHPSISSVYMKMCERGHWCRHPSPLRQPSHPWQLPRVTRPTLGVLWSVWTPTPATVTGTARRWTDVRRWERRGVKKAKKQPSPSVLWHAPYGHNFWCWQSSKHICQNNLNRADTFVACTSSSSWVIHKTFYIIYGFLKVEYAEQHTSIGLHFRPLMVVWD